MIVAEPLGGLPVTERHADPDGEIRLRVVPALGAIDYPGAIWSLADLGVVGLQLVSRE
jgi:hypothetical protein